MWIVKGNLFFPAKHLILKPSLETFPITFLLTSDLKLVTMSPEQGLEHIEELTLIIFMHSFCLGAQRGGDA